MPQEMLFESAAMNYDAVQFLKYVSKSEIQSSLVQIERDFVLEFTELYDYIKSVNKPLLEEISDNTLTNFALQQQLLQRFNVQFHEKYCKMYNTMKNALKQQLNNPDNTYIRKRMNEIHLLQNIVQHFCEKYQCLATI